MTRGRPPLVVFVPLAMNQTTFYVGLADELASRGYRTAFIPFHERSVAYIEQRGHRAFNVFGSISERDRPSPGQAEAYARKYGIANLNRVLVHEKVSFEISNTRRLTQRFVDYMAALELIFDDLRKGSGEEGICVVQELGGFLSILTAYFIARGHGIDNVFVEPSFFRGRVFFIRNSLSVLRVEERPVAAPSPELEAYLELTLRNQAIVIPVKDALQYRDITNKVASPYNLRRLVEKLVDKYVLGYREEFSHIWVWTRRHLRMLVNKYLMPPLYSDMPAGERFVYYPLHVPTDFALTVRAPEYLDQYALLDYVAKCLPLTHKLCIKEHPALVGALNRRRVRELLEANDNVVLLWPTTNNFSAMRRAEAVLTINSKSGAEALLLRRPVIVLGDSFYSRCSGVTYVESLRGLEPAFREVLEGAGPRDDSGPAIGRFFQNVWEQSWPGELYDTTAGNLCSFAESLDRFLEHAGGGE